MQHLERLGGFPALSSSHWEPKLSLEQLLATLHLDFNISPLFELKIAADDMNNTQHIILVRTFKFHRGKVILEKLNDLLFD